MPERREQSPRTPRRLDRAVAAAIFLVPLALVVSRCAVSEAVPWVVPSPRAPWVMPPGDVDAELRQWGQLEVPVAHYRLRVRPAKVAADAALLVRTLGDARVRIDGALVATLERAGVRGRAAARVVLRATPGAALELEVDVVNARGPGLLAVTSVGVEPPVTTGPEWRVALGEAEAVPAIVADDTRRNARALAVETPWQALRAHATVLAALALFGGAGFALLRRRVGARGFGLAAPVVASVAWLGPLAAKLLRIPTDVGFDARHHVLYAERLLADRTLPAAAEGWSTYHPPLFHAAAAAILGLGGGTASLKALPLLAGLGGVWVAWGLSRRLFPAAPERAGLAALFVAVLPVNLYSAAYFSNEALQALLAGAALLAVVVQLLRERATPGGVGLAALLLGAAALTKFTALVVLPVALFFLVWKLVAVERAPAQRSAGLPLGFVGVFALVAGWFYLRNWLAYGTPLVGNWALPGEDQRWWQQPGFHTPAYYLRFGEALVHPYLSGFRSFWDALYSTAWGDGFIAGRTDPWRRHAFWSYGFMSAGYWLALPATLLVGAGSFLLALRALGSGPARERLALGFLLTVCWAVALAFLTLTFELAFFAQAKASYLLMLAAPAGLAFASGYAGLDAWLERRAAQALRAALAGWLTAFAGALFLGFAA